MRIISTTDFSIGLYISGIGHLGLITWALMGNPFLSRDPFNDFIITQVKIISEEQFQMTKVGRVVPVEDSGIGKLPTLKEESIAPLKHNKGIKVGEEIKINDKESEELTKLKVVKGQQKMLIDKSKINGVVTMNDKNGSNTEVKSLPPKSTESQVSGITNSASATDKREGLLSDNSSYKPFDISELLLKEVFKNDPVENILEDSKVIFELKKIIEPAVEKCFNISNVALSVKEASVLINFSLKENGRPETSSIELMSFNGGNIDDTEKLFGAARRAIIRCGILGYNLPKDKYHAWKNVEAKFNSKGMQVE